MMETQPETLTQNSIVNSFVNLKRGVGRLDEALGAVEKKARPLCPWQRPGRFRRSRICAAMSDRLPSPSTSPRGSRLREHKEVPELRPQDAK